MPRNAAAVSIDTVTISALDRSAADWESVIAMFVQASTEDAICATTYLPPAMTAAQARSYCAAHHGYVIRHAGEPSGAVLIHHVPRPGDGVQLPAHCVEIEFWILSRFRDRAVFRRAWPAISEALANRYTDVAAVCWADNHAACRSLHGCGFRHLGRSFWSDADESGWCEVYVYDLRNPPTLPTQ